MLDGKGRVLPILREEAKRNGYSVEELISRDHHAHIVAVRHYAMWRARNETGRSWWEIARVFARDHTTVIHGYRKVQAMPEELRGVFPPRPKSGGRTPLSEYGRRYQGKPCRQGHDGTRYWSDGGCVQCQRIYDRTKRKRKRTFYAEAAE